MASVTSKIVSGKPRGRKLGDPMRQEYFCEKCGLQGYIHVDEHEDVMSAVNKLEAGHYLWSPECDQPVRKLRVVNHSAASGKRATDPERNGRR